MRSGFSDQTIALISVNSHSGTRLYLELGTGVYVVRRNLSFDILLIFLSNCIINAARRSPSCASYEEWPTCAHSVDRKVPSARLMRRLGAAKRRKIDRFEAVY